MVRNCDNHLKRTARLLASGERAHLLCDCPRCVRLRAVHEKLFAQKGEIVAPPERLLYKIFASYERLPAKQSFSPLKLVPAAAFFAIAFAVAAFFVPRPQQLLYTADASAKIQPLEQGAAIITTGTPRRIFLDHEVEIVCAPATELRIDSMRSSGSAIVYTFSLNRGKITAAFHASEHSFKYEFIMPDSVLRSTGTEFTISLHEGASRIQVAQGSVRLSHTASGTVRDAHAGETYISRAGGFEIEKPLRAAGIVTPKAEAPEEKTAAAPLVPRRAKKASEPAAEELPVVPAEDEKDADQQVIRPLLPDVSGVDESERRLRSIEERALRRR